MSTAISEYRIDLRNVQDMDAFVAAFNEGLIHAAGGHWDGNSWDAFNDYLSWLAQESYRLLLDGWSRCRALGEEDNATFEHIVAANPHVLVSRT